MPAHRLGATTLLWHLLVICITQVSADGTGILGAGKWLYRPTCAHSCRRLIINSPLVCDDDATSDHTSGSHSHSAAPSTTCFLNNAPFLRTLALCLSTHCASDDVPLSTLQEYWEAHVATGTLSNHLLTPALPYHAALRDAELEQANRTLGNIIPGEPLNETMLVAVDVFLPWYNYQKGFEDGEIGHGRNSIVVTTTAVGLPILISLSTLLPYRWISLISAHLDQPLVGRVYRVPFLNAGTMPTLGQALFFTYLVVMNIILMCLPLSLRQPNARLPEPSRQALQVIGDRAGVLAAANLVPLLLTSSRNNVLLWLTNWSHTTFLLTHRWLGYIVIIQTVVHSAGLLHYSLLYSNHAADAKLPYWYWGIVSTLALCLVWPLSILPIRRRAYEIFLTTHQLLAALAMITYFLHIWYLFKYDWGYEIWVYVAGAIWFLDRLLRLFRIAVNGTRTAVITSLGDGSELLNVRIEGVFAEGHVYLYFPTLTWRFWENHPFSVLSAFDLAVETPIPIGSAGDPKITAKRPATAQMEPVTKSPNPGQARREAVPGIRLLLRPQNGSTFRLAQKVQSKGTPLSIPVWVEDSYHTQSTKKLLSCSSLLCIAGGVGITAVLPVLRSYDGPSAKLFWGVKHDDIVNAVAAEIDGLGPRLQTETRIRERLDVETIVQDELLNSEARGNVGIMVCGPAEMADHVRLAIGKVAGRSKRGIVFLDEAFAW
ncbi:hypothetical protein B0A52_06668 [Exophiala mesophila]|uniref:Ferric oxidoreductase domain-containing protein n=1 Tax=Exophiala mesophila TaxID=212818 RepID=A0A438N1S9_EXOME|nr:hypothetical protein B0A52_06668 [Exophiala mesophila]